MKEIKYQVTANFKNNENELIWEFDTYKEVENQIKGIKNFYNLQSINVNEIKTITTNIENIKI